MTREQKYPNTSTFRFHNENPKGRFTTDCTFRALARATGESYATVVRELAELHIKTGYECTDDRTIDKYLQSKGFTKQKQPRKDDNTKYTGVEFCEAQQRWVAFKFAHENEWKDNIVISPTIVAKIGSHHIVAIMDGKVNDTWNSTNGKIGNYWTK